MVFIIKFISNSTGSTLVESQESDLCLKTKELCRMLGIDTSAMEIAPSTTAAHPLRTPIDESNFAGGFYSEIRVEDLEEEVDLGTHEIHDDSTNLDDSAYTSEPYSEVKIDGYNADPRNHDLDPLDMCYSNAHPDFRPKSSYSDENYEDTVMEIPGFTIKSENLTSHPFHCTVCNEGFSSRIRLDKHSIEHLSLTEPQSSIFALQHKQKVTNKAVAPKKNYYQLYKLSGKIKVGKNREKKEESVTCHLCKKHHTNMGNLMRHYASIHYVDELRSNYGPAKGECGICNQVLFILQNAV